MERIILNAPTGFIYTNGNSYGRTIYLAIGANETDWELITESEYENIIKQQEENEQYIH